MGWKLKSPDDASEICFGSKADMCGAQVHVREALIADFTLIELPRKAKALA
jgi:hypothetical protein